MLKTREKKEKQVRETVEQVKDANTVVLANFTGTTANAMNAFRKSLAETGAKFKIIKKRILRLIFKESEVDIDPTQLEGQIGVIISPNNITETAQTAYAFRKKNRKTFKLLGGAELQTKNILSAKEVNAIGKLPSRDVLMGQLVGMLASPIKSFLFVISERKRSVPK